MSEVASLKVLDGLRIVACLQAAVEKLQVLGSLTSDWQSDELTQMLGEEISRVILEQRDLEVRYAASIARRAELKSISNKQKAKENEEEISRISLALQQSTKLLCRNLQDNPNLEGNLEKIDEERANLEKLLTKTQLELQTSATLETLRRRVEKEQNEMDTRAAIIERERALSKQVEDLKRQILQEKKQFEDDVKTKNLKIAQLKEEFQQMKANTALDTKYMLKQAQAQADCLQRRLESELTDHEAHVRSLEQHVAIEKRANKLMEDFLKMKVSRMGENIEAWNQKHDSDTSILGNKLELLRQVREADLVQLKTLEDRFKADLQAREDRRKEEVRQAELLRIRAQELTRRSEAALTIQCSTRKWLAKQALINIKNPKKGKKGGGGKDKGKGKKK